MGNNPRLEEPYDLSPERTVLLGVDFQQGFGDGAWEHTPDAAAAATNLVRLRRSGVAPEGG